MAKWAKVGAAAVGVTGAMIALCNYNKLFAAKKSGERRTIYVGTRKSPLAMVQTEFVISELRKRHPHLEFEILSQETKGDRILDVPLAKIGDKGLFTSELEARMHNHEIDIAVHSCKDLMTTLTPGLCIGAYLERHPREDVFIVKRSHQGRYKSISDLPAGSVIGTSSLRRRAMLAHKHPGLIFKDIRGNIGTRLARLDDEANGYDATILAHAGLLRMESTEYSSRITQVLKEEEYMYAVAQGILAVECREDDKWLLETVLGPLNHKDTQHEAEAERGLLRGLEGGCHVPLSCRCTRENGRILLEGAVLALDGTECVRDSFSGSENAATAIGHELSHRLSTQGGKELLERLHTDK